MSDTISFSLHYAEERLASVSDTPQLEAQILLAHILQKTRSYLHGFSDMPLTPAEREQFSEILERRVQGEPIAYLIGHREFWSLDFIVTRDTLIPRPETELLVELVLKKCVGENKFIADLGTGSGAIALAIAHERPSWEVHATEASASALEIAKQNAQQLGCTVHFHHGSWCEALPKLRYDCIVSNPPYIAADDAHLHALRFEPLSALVSDDDGLRDLRHIILEARDYLKPGGFLVVEHGFQQAEEVKRFFQKAGYTHIDSYQDLSGSNRAIMAQF